MDPKRPENVTWQTLTRATLASKSCTFAHAELHNGDQNQVLGNRGFICELKLNFVSHMMTQDWVLRCFAFCQQWRQWKHKKDRVCLSSQLSFFCFLFRGIRRGHIILILFHSQQFKCNVQLCVLTTKIIFLPDLLFPGARWSSATVHILSVSTSPAARLIHRVSLPPPLPVTTAGYTHTTPPSCCSAQSSERNKTQLRTFSPHVFSQN